MSPRFHPPVSAAAACLCAAVVACGSDSPEGRGSGGAGAPASGDTPSLSGGQANGGSGMVPMGDGMVGAPTITRAIAGDGQTAEVNSTVPVAPVVLVTDGDGDPVPGVAVEFYVSAGNGAVTGASAVTGSNGTATVGSWTLGPVPGPQELTGEVAGLAPALFTATATADASGSLLPTAGDFQSATVRTAVGTAPSVQLLEQDGTPVVGVEVVFTVSSGGGQVTGATATTDDDGVAVVGSWTLGNSPGPNTLTATTNGLPPVVFRANAVSADDPVLTRSTYLSGLARPWALAFLPDGTLFFTERPGRLRVLPAGEATPRTLAEPDDVNAETQSGMLGVALDPDFATNRQVYVFMSSNRSGTMDNRIRRFTVDAALTTATEDRDILTGMAWGDGGGHSGGRLRFGPDGFLYVTTGDTRSATVPQDLAVMGGKILRITKEGSPAPGNPDLGEGARPEIFAYGFRNPQGIAFRPGSEQLFLCEHGPNQDDEVTRLVAGGNGGWNPNDGMGNYNGYSGAVMTDTSLFPDALPPAYVVTDSEGMCGCDFLVGPEWKSWDGRLAVAMLAGRRMTVAGFDAEGTTTVGPVLEEYDGDARLRTVVQGPDGAAFVAVDADAPNGEIWRIAPN